MCKLTNPKVPYFNGPIFLENKTQVGKVEEIFGPINASMFTIKMAEGVVASSYSKGDKFHISPDKLLPMERFLGGGGGGGGGGRRPGAAAAGAAVGAARRGGRGGGRGGGRSLRRRQGRRAFVRRRRPRARAWPRVNAPAGDAARGSRRRTRVLRRGIGLSRRRLPIRRRCRCPAAERVGACTSLPCATGTPPSPARDRIMRLPRRHPSL